MRRLVLLAATICLVALPAAAEMVARSEAASVAWAFSAPEGLERPVTVMPGDVVWRETFRPHSSVRLLDPVAGNSAPMTKPLPVGTILYAYRMKTGYAYCPTTEFPKAKAGILCLRDFDKDGHFDGAYVGEMSTSYGRVVAALLHNLYAANKQRYEPSDPDPALVGSADVRFIGFEKSKPAFKISYLGQTFKTTRYCEPTADGACQVLGLTLKVTPQGKGASIELLSVKPDRGSYSQAGSWPALLDPSEKKA
jgi:hypothetical protein